MCTSAVYPVHAYYAPEEFFFRTFDWLRQPAPLLLCGIYNTTQTRSRVYTTCVHVTYRNIGNISIKTINRKAPEKKQTVRDQTKCTYYVYIILSCTSQTTSVGITPAATALVQRYQCCIVVYTHSWFYVKSSFCTNNQSYYCEGFGKKKIMTRQPIAKRTQFLPSEIMSIKATQPFTNPHSLRDRCTLFLWFATRWSHTTAGESRLDECRRALLPQLQREREPMWK